MASFESIKQLFTNGGGWYNVNSAHPFENPTPLTNFLEMLAIIVVPMAQVYMFGLLVGNKKHAWCLFNVMLAMYRVLVRRRVVLRDAAQSGRSAKHPPNMEGKEQRIGVMNSVLWGVSCTAIDNGSVNSMHDSWMPLAGMMPMWNILIGEIMFGGIGCGMYCMLFHVLITVFIAGLMIGRTPEYLGKKLDAWCATWAVIGVLIPNAACSAPDGHWPCMLPAGPVQHEQRRPARVERNPLLLRRGGQQQWQRLRRPERQYALLQRRRRALSIMDRTVRPRSLPRWPLSGRLASKKTVEASSGTLPTHGWTFGLTLTGVIIVVAALTFFPALCLGPIVEHGLMLAGRAF